MKGDDQGQVEHSKVFRNSKMCKKKYLSAKCNKALNIFLEFTKYKTRGEYHRYCTTFPFSGHYDCPKIAFQ